MEIKHFSLSCLAVLALISCARETDIVSSNDVIVSFIVAGDESATKSNAGRMSNRKTYVNDLSADSGIAGLNLVETVVMLDDTYLATTGTKGTPVYTENIASLYDKIAVSAYKGSEPWGRPDRLYSHNGDVWSYNYSSLAEDGNLRWPDNEDLCFYLKVPVAADGCSNISYSGGNISFGYTSPKGAEDSAADAVAQKDILFSSKSLSFEGKTDAGNRIRLFHALTAVKFKNGSSDIDIQGVVFNNLYSKGSCTIVPDHSKKSGECVSWSELSERTQFAQEFSGLVSVSAADKKGTSFADSFYSGNTSLNNLNDSSFEQTFMFVPQSLNGASVTVYYTYAEEPRSQTIRLDGRVWLPGELHTYTLAFTETGLEIRDNVSKETQTKSDVKITNVGNTPSYIRATFVANWKNDSGTIYSKAWNETQGRFSGFPGSGWAKGADGFWYYTRIISAGATISNDLFQSYVAPAAPADGLHLEMAIVAQAVPASRINDAKAGGWGVGINFSSEVDGQ